MEFYCDGRTTQVGATHKDLLGINEAVDGDSEVVVQLDVRTGVDPPINFLARGIEKGDPGCRMRRERNESGAGAAGCDFVGAAVAGGEACVHKFSS